jgi:hypothetical protein
MILVLNNNRSTRWMVVFIIYILRKCLCVTAKKQENRLLLCFLQIIKNEGKCNFIREIDLNFSKN